MKGKTENTVSLIGKWSMAGAIGDFGGRFGSPVDIHALVAERDEARDGDVTPPASDPVLMKLAGEDGWQALAPSPA